VSLVLDASATLAWVFPDENTPAIQTVFDQILDEYAYVPSLWRLEVANTLSVAIRRKRFDRANRNNALVDLTTFPIIEDPETARNAWNETLSLADRHRITVYDATYLELALRLSLPLATLDEDLREAAQSEGVTLLGK
jgi:predicted nucleic acid-binding protein